MDLSDVYWSACYNGNLWQIRYNLQNTAMTYRLPILLALVLAVVVAWLKPKIPWGLSKLSGRRSAAAIPENGAVPLGRKDGQGPVTAAIPSQGARAPAQPPAPADPKAQALLHSAIKALEGRVSISARFRQRADLFGQQLIAAGYYLELRQGLVPRLRLEQKGQVGEEVMNLVVVCDGTTLWTYRKLFQAESLIKIDAVRASAAIARADGDCPDFRGRENPGSENGTVPFGQPARFAPGLGGLPRLLRGLNAVFEFTSAQRGSVGELPVWKLEGRWQKAQLLKLLPKQREAIEQGKPADLGRLPEHLPDRVVLLLGQEDLFPYRLDYCRTNVKKGDRPEAATSRSLMTVEWFEVNFNVPIDVRQFVYIPGSIQAADQTEVFLQSLGR
jgi:hypothetical protein